MNALLLALTLIFLCGAVSFYELRQWTREHLLVLLYERGSQARAGVERAQALGHWFQLKMRPEEMHFERKRRSSCEPSERPRRLVSLNVNADRPPNNARLNLFFLYAKQGGRESIAYECLCRDLMRRLYGEQTFLRGRMEERIVEELQAHSLEEVMSFKTPDQLAELSFRDPAVREVFYKMLHGGESSEGRYPSLLSFITFDAFDEGDRVWAKRINLFFAPSELLAALLPEERLSDFLAFRAELLERVFTYEEEFKEHRVADEVGRKQMQDLLRQGFRAHFGEGRAFEHLFEFSLGIPGTVIFYTDPDSQITLRRPL